MTTNRGFLLAGQVLAAALAVAVVVMTAASNSAHPGRKQQREAERLNGEGVVAYEGGDFARAGDLFERALDLDPENTTVRQNLALAVFADAIGKATKGGEVVFDERALRLMQTASSLDPERAEIHAALGKMYFMGTRFDEARTELTEASRLAPSDGESVFLLGEIAHREGDITGALEKWEEAARLEPQNELYLERLEQARKESDVEDRFARREHRHFALRYDTDPAEIRDATDEMLFILEDAYRHVGRELGIRPLQTVSVVVYEEKDFRSITGLHDWAQGVYDGRIRVPYGALRNGAKPMRQVFYHEYTHAAVFEASRGRCPVWLNEGLAQLMSGEWDSGDTDFIEGALKSSSLPPLQSLEGAFIGEADPIRVRVMYGESYAAARYLVERYGRATMTEALRTLGAGRTMSQVLNEVYSTSYDAVDLEIRRRIERGDFRT